MAGPYVLHALPNRLIPYALTIHFTGTTLVIICDAIILESLESDLEAPGDPFSRRSTVEGRILRAESSLTARESSHRLIELEKVPAGVWIKDKLYVAIS